jgi:hypothetical protein
VDVSWILVSVRPPVSAAFTAGSFFLIGGAQASVVALLILACLGTLARICAER